MNSFGDFFSGKKVLVTGSTGFKGSWLVVWLEMMGAHVVGVGLPPRTDPSLYCALKLSKTISREVYCDVRDAEAVKKLVCEVRPDFVFHLAAQAIVQDGYRDPVLTWSTNVVGTMAILDALRFIGNECSVVIVTSDKCYQNQEWEWGYREDDRLGGDDPYSASKAACELLFKSYCRSFFVETDSNGVKLASVRAGNVLGGGDWSEGRVVPDCIRSWVRGDSVALRNPKSTRPWQHVLEPLSGYLLVAKMLMIGELEQGKSYNFGPRPQENHTVESLVSVMAEQWGSGARIVDAVVGPSEKRKRESSLLKLDCSRAGLELNWQPTWNFRQTAQATVDWYKRYHSGENVRNLTEQQIKTYIDDAKQLCFEWVT